MSGGLFRATDPHLLDRYSGRRPLRRRLPWATRRRLLLQIRAMQSLPPRELYMLFAVKVLRQQQKEVAELLHVKQSNISYRILRAYARIPLLVGMWETISETEFRSVLIDLGLDPMTILLVTGSAKTLAQGTTARSHGTHQGKVKDCWGLGKRLLDAKIAELGEDCPDRYLQAQKLMKLVAANWGNFGMRPQARYLHKLSYSQTLTKIKPPVTQVPNSGG